MELLIFSKFDETFSKESVEIIPANCNGKEAKILPDFTTTIPP